VTYSQTSPTGRAIRTEASKAGIGHPLVNEGAGAARAVVRSRLPNAPSPGAPTEVAEWGRCRSCGLLDCQCVGKVLGQSPNGVMGGNRIGGYADSGLGFDVGPYFEFTQRVQTVIREGPVGVDGAA